MKWSSLLNDIKDRIGLHSPASTATSTASSSSSSPSCTSREDDASSTRQRLSYSSSSNRDGLEVDFKRFWEVFRSSKLEKEKEAALIMTVDAFCKLMEQHSNVTQLVTMLVETHVFSFVVGRAFVTDIEKLKISSKTRTLGLPKVLQYFSEVSKDGIRPGANLLTTVGVLVSSPIDQQSLLDSGIFCCLIHVFNTFLSPKEPSQGKSVTDSEEQMQLSNDSSPGAEQARQLEVEGSVVHIMKALASHASAAQSLIEDDSLMLLFQMVANGSLSVFSCYKEGLISLHNIQLHRHAMQILGLLLANDSGSTAKYIQRHNLIKVLLMAIKHFNSDSGDPAYTVGIADLLLQCVELSYRPEAGGTRLRDDIHNAHGHHFLVQFALVLSSRQQLKITGSAGLEESKKSCSSKNMEESSDLVDLEATGRELDSSQDLSPTLCRLLDMLVNLSQTGPVESKASKSPHTKNDETWEHGNTKIKDLEAVQMLQDIFLKANNSDLQAEVLNRLFKILSSHLENYKLCQQLRTVPLLILNMSGFPKPLQDIVLKILEYAVTVVSCVPEQELLSLCCLLQQPITSELKHTILSFFIKLLSFDQQYKKVLREVGVLEVLLDDLKHHKSLLGSDQSSNRNQLGRKSNSSSFKKHWDTKDVIIPSAKLMESGSGKFPIFEAERTISIAWDFLLSLLKKAEGNQSSFRSAEGVATILPFLMSETHRPGVLRIFSCLITEDNDQAHPEELGGLVEVLKSAVVTSISGYQYKLQTEAICDTMGALWRIMGLNKSAQRVFGEATGFSLLLTTFHRFKDGGLVEEPSLAVCIKLFAYLLRLLTAAVCGNAINRTKLHAVISSQAFNDIFSESALLCVELEKRVIQLLLELALEVVVPPFLMSENANSLNIVRNESVNSVSSTLSGSFSLDKERVYNAGAIRVLLCSLLQFSPSMQLEVLDLIENLARVGPFNQDSLTSVGCVELVLKIIHPFLSGSSQLLVNALKIVEVLGAYRLSSSELQVLIRYIVQMRQMKSGHIMVEMMERLILTEDMVLENVPLAPFLEMDMRKVGHASIQVSLGDRSWPPAAGYSFTCWFQFRNHFRTHKKDTEPIKAGSKMPNSSNEQHNERHFLRLFSVGAVSNDNSFYVELYLQDNGVLTLSTSNSSSLSFSGIELEEGKWHHLAVVHSKPNALAGLFQPSIANVYLDGKLKHAGKLGYSPSPIGKSLHVVIGTPITCARVSDLTWRLRSCHLFEEVLTPGCICFIYMLGSGYRGLFQDSDLLRFIPDQACGGSSMAILESMDADLALASSTQKVDNSNRQVDFKADGSEIVWDLDRLRNLSLQLSGRKLIFAFDGTFTEAVRSSGTSFMLNLVDPLSAAASPIGGIPRFGRLHGDIYICKQCVIGDTIQPVGGMVVVLALVEAAESTEMLHMALSLLACALHQNPQNVRDMQTLRGYHLLALFLRRRMSLFDTHCLEIFFQIAACEASFSEPNKLLHVQTPVSPAAKFPEASFEDINFSKFPEDSSVESHSDMAEDFYTQKDSCSHMSEIENTEVPVATSNCIVLSNADMVEYVLLDWTLWVTAQVPIQVALLGFLEQLVSMHWYRNHNLTILREISLVQHLLVTLQRADVEVPVLEKLVVLLRVILEDGFLTSEVDNVVKFVIMTFDPPELKPRHQIIRESMGKHIIVRNMLLEMLIELQVTIKAEEILEQWYKNVSSRLLIYFLDEAVHPTSMRCIMTLLGVCLTTSPTFALKFRTSGRYQSLMRILPSFYDSPDVYYILFCLVFGKPVYPRLPEVRMLDFHALMPCNGDHVELKFVELLDSIISMAKSTFDRLMLQLMLAQQTGNPSQLVAELIDQNADTSGELQGEALMHKTYAARLMGGEASAPAETTSILRFMVDLAKICPTFSAVCRRTEFLEGCIDLYFSCCRAAYAVQMSREISLRLEEKNLNDCSDANSRDLFSTIHPGQEESANASIGMRSYPQAEVGTYSDETPAAPNYSTEYRADVKETVPQKETFKSVQDDTEVLETIDGNSFQLVSSSNESSSHDIKHNIPQVHPAISSSSSSLIPDSTILSERSSSNVPLTASSAPVVTPTSLRAIYTESKSFSPIESFVSATDSDATTDLKSWYQGQQGVNSFFPVFPELLLKVDDLGYGGGPCSAGGTAVLDFLAEVLADILTEQLKATQTIENNLEMLPLYVETDSMLVFQGLCLSRLMIFLERRLLRDDEEDEKKLDKSKWSSNLDAFCWLIVDRVYMGAFPQATSVLRTLEFLLSMLQLANKDGRIEEAAPAGKGILSMGRGSRQLDAYIQSILKNTNRMVLYCFLPSFLTSIGENDLLLFVGLLKEANKQSTANSSQQDSGIDIATVLQLLVAHRPIIFCPSNLDADMNCCLCINLIPLTLDGRCNVQNMAIDIIKYLILHRKTSMEDLLILKLNQGQHLDVLHGGFDKLLTENLSAFLEWFQSSEHIVTKVLEQNATAMWNQYLAGAEKFPGVRIKGIEARRKKDMDRRSKETVKLDLKHWEQATERRNLLVLVRDEMSTELRVVRQDKYGWVLHAESEWQKSIQQLVHKRGIFPLRKTVVPEDPEWQLCPIEGPYRMRKKLEHCKIRIYCIQDVLDGELQLGDTKLSETKSEDSPDVSRSGSGPIFNHLTHEAKQNGSGTDLYIDCLFKELDDTDYVSSVKNGWNDDRASSANEASLHSGIEFAGKSNTISVPLSVTVPDRSVPGSPWKSSSAKAEEATILDDKSDTELNDNGEYLIRPYLEPLEKIRCRYNCERVLGLDKQDGIFLIGELCLYVIENLYIDDSGCICEKEDRDELSVIDQALGVKKDLTGSLGFQSSGTSPCSRATKTYVGARAWAYNNGARGKEKACQNRNLPHPWRKWKLDSVHEILKRDYQLRPVAIEVFSMDGCNDLLVFLKREREEVFKNLVAMNLPRNSMLDTTISGSAKQENNEGSRLFKLMAKSFSKRWQNGEISNFQYLMHLNTLAGRGYRDLTQYPVFPWVLADYESENLDLSDPKTFRKLDKPMGCQTPEGAEEFKKRYDSWDDPEVPQFHYGSHYSSAGIVLFYLLRLPPFSSENQKLQGGQFDHADRLFNNIRDTWLSAAGKSNTSDVKELIPEFFYMPEFLENRFNLDLGEKQSGEKVGDVILPPWAKGSTREFIRKHRKALESNYVSEHLHHWIDLIFGYKQRGKAAEEAVNVFYHYTYEGSVDIDSVNDPAMKASILAQINHFGQTPKQLFRKPHVKRWTDRKLPTHPLRHSSLLIAREIRKHLTSIREIVYFHEKILIAGGNRLLKPRTYTKYIAWGFPDRSLRFMSCDQDRLISTHESLHGLNQITCADFTHDGHILVTGADDGLISVWRISQDGPQPSHRVLSKKALCAHTAKVTCLYVSQPYMLIASGSDDCTVILWDLSSLAFVRQLPEFPAPVSAIYVNDLSGEIVTAAGVLLAVWSINGDCLSVVNKDQVPLDSILCVTSCIFSDWLDKNWYVTGHQSGAVKVWHMVHPVDLVMSLAEFASYGTGGLDLGGNMPEYMLMLHKVLNFHKHPVTSLHVTTDLKQFLSGDSDGHLVSWTLPDESFKASFDEG